MNELWTSLRLSSQIAGTATLLTVLLGVPLAFFMSRRRFPGKSAIEALIMVPMVLPPTVVGYIILMLLGRRGPVGAWLFRTFDYTIIFRFEGAVLAAAVVALPMLYMPAKAAFLGVDRELEDVSLLLGASRFQMFWHVSVPLASRGIISGLVLAFARALGEFGATVMVYGWQPHHFTLPISIYADYERDDLSHSAPAVATLALMSLCLMLAYNRLSLRARE
jgi:molybdate transport system permease protein